MSSEESLKKLVENAIEVLQKDGAQKALEYLNTANNQLKESPRSKKIRTVNKFVTNPMLLLIIGAILNYRK
jgi:hypothetical protein